MCRNLVANAIPRDLISDGVTVFNRTRHTAIEFRNSAEGDGQDQIIVADMANEAIEQSDIIFLCLSNDAAVTEVVTGALENARLELSGKTFVDCSTVHPTTTSFIAGQVGKVGSELVTCPVLGMPTAAAAGQVVCLLGGPAAGVNKILPLLVDVICRKAIVVSWTDAKMALALKLVANTFLLSMQEALAEGHTLAERCGVTADKVEEVLATILPGIYLTNSKMMTSGDYYKDKNVSLTTHPTEVCSVHLLTTVYTSPSSALAWHGKMRATRCS